MNTFPDNADSPPACRGADKRTVLGQGQVTIRTDSEGRVASVQVFDPIPDDSIVLTAAEARIVDRWARENFLSGKFPAPDTSDPQWNLWNRLPDTEDTGF